MENSLSSIKTLFPFETVGPNMAPGIGSAGCALNRGIWRREGSSLAHCPLVRHVSSLSPKDVVGAVVR